MSESSCEKYAQVLDAYQDGELAPSERAEVERHLESCDACRSALADIQLVVSSLKALPQLNIKKDFALDIEKAIGAAQDRKVVPLARPAAWTALGIAAAVALLVFVSRPALVPNTTVTADNHLQNQSPVRNQVTGNSAPPTVIAEKVDLSKAASGSGINVNDDAHQRQIAHAQGVQKSSGETTASVAHKGSNRILVGQKIVPVDLTKNKSEPGTDIASGVNTVAEKNHHAGNELADANNSSLLALYDSDQDSVTDELGITTDEDGLYAIKL